MPKMSSATPSYSFHGSNSSHSKDSGQGGRTYHVPNYATSYANEKSHLISVTFDEDKGAKKTIIAIVLMFILLLVFSAPSFVGGPQRSFDCFPNQDTIAEHRKRPGAIESSPQQTRLPVVESTETAGADNWPMGGADNGATSGGRAKHKDESAASPVPGLYWTDLQGSKHCIAYGTRRYTARLRNVSFWTNNTRACTKTAIQINGVTVPSPDECEVKWPFGGVRGHWNVNFKEDDCNPVWGKFTDKGCIMKGSHKRLFRSRLWNIKNGEDGLLLCKTAPANILSIYYPKPHSCKDEGIWGTYGTWVVEDMKC